MKKFFLYALTALTALTAVSCKDDDDNFGGANDLDRMPMTLFRRAGNTGTSESTDQYVSSVDKDIPNKITLRWYGIEGCAGYELKYAIGQGGLGEQWDNPDRMEEVIKLDPDVLEYTIENLDYLTDYCFAIRVLSPKGEAYHSKWSGVGSLSQWDDVCAFMTGDRYPEPEVLSISNPTKTSFRVNIALDYASSGDNATNNFTEHFDVVDGKYVVDRMQVWASPDNFDAAVDPKWSNYVLTDEDKERGYVEVDGLEANSTYLVTLINDARIFIDPRTGKEIDVDAQYNKDNIRTLGDIGPDKLIEHIVDPNDTIPGAVDFKACRLDTIVMNFNKDNSLAEGQVFYLEGGKAYYFAVNTELTKGFTMKTREEDLAAGNRAKVYLGGIYQSGASGTTIGSNNFILGRNRQSGEKDVPIKVQTIRFEGIDFDVPLAENYGSGKGATQNYFINMYSGGMAIAFDAFELVDCTFQGMIRGFFRTQGAKKKLIHNLLVENCIFYNCGYYDNNGRGYSWFDCDKNNLKTNIYENFTMRNCTMYDSPRHALMTNGDSDQAWGPDVKYNITLENNTFINFSTRSKDRTLFQLRYIPGGSKLTVRNNLIVLAADDADNRNLHSTTCDIRGINGNGQFTLDVANNFSVGCRDAHMKDDGIFTAKAFSSSSNSLGKYWNEVPGLLSGNKDDLIVRVGSTPLKATDLFNNPNPRYHASGNESNGDYHRAPDNIFEALRYKQTDLVHNHEIWTLNVGDPRWRN